MLQPCNNHVLNLPAGFIFAVHEGKLTTEGLNKEHVEPKQTKT